MDVIHALTFFIGICLCTCLAGDKEKQKEKQPETRKAAERLLLISLDGFRWNYLNGRAKTPNFDSVKQNGVHARRGLKNAFLTNTLPNHFSMVTGLYVESHGIVDNFMFDPVMNERFIPKFYDKNSYNHPHWHSTVGEPIWVANQVQKQHGRSGVIMWMGGETVIKDIRPSRHLPHDDDVPNKEKIDILINWLTDAKEPINLGVVYFHEPDITGHKFGPESREVTERIEELDFALGYLLLRLEDSGLAGTTDIIITSDHGFVSVGKDKLIRLDEIIDPKWYSDTSFLPGPVAGILPAEGQEDTIYRKLKVASDKAGTFTVYKKQDIPERFHYKNHRRVPPIFAMAQPGYTFVYEKHLEGFWLEGNHGYDNELEDMHPFFVAVGPSFRKDFSVETFQNVDIYPLMCHLLQLKPAPNNGSMSIVSQLLREAEEKPVRSISYWLYAVLILSVLLVVILGHSVTGSKHKRN